MLQMPGSAAFMHACSTSLERCSLQIDLDLLRSGKGAQVFGQTGRWPNGGVHAHMAAHAVGVFTQFALACRAQAQQHVAGAVQQALARGHRNVTPGTDSGRAGPYPAVRPTDACFPADAAMNSRSAAAGSAETAPPQTIAAKEVRVNTARKLRLDSWSFDFSKRRFHIFSPLAVCHRGRR